jgi:hypothetical protein
MLRSPLSAARSTPATLNPTKPDTSRAVFGQVGRKLGSIIEPLDTFPECCVPEKEGPGHIPGTCTNLPPNRGWLGAGAGQ